MKFALPACFALLLCCPWSVAGAQTPPQSSASSATAGAAVDAGVQRIENIFSKPHVSNDSFDASFLEKMPAPKVEAIVKQLKNILGDYKDVKKSTEKNQPPFDDTWGRYVAEFSKGTEDIYIRLDSAGKVDGLIFRELHQGGS